MIFMQAFRKYNEGSVVELVDPLMEEAVNGDVLMKMLDLAFQCAALLLCSQRRNSVM